MKTPHNARAPFTRRDFLSASAKVALVLTAGRTLFAQGTTQNLGSLAFGSLETSQALTDAQIDGIARSLLAQLTLDEKIDMMSGEMPFYPGLLHMNAGGYNRHPLTRAGAIPRLGIPGIRFTDGPRGVMLAGATTFPAAMARGASWDVQLEERVGDAMGREARANGANMIGAPCINLLRHPA